LIVIALHLALALETRGFASVQGDAIPTAGTRKLHVPRGSIDLLSEAGLLLTPLGTRDQERHSRSLTSRKTDVSLTARNRHITLFSVFEWKLRKAVLNKETP
jgi:hypothetical protein